MMVGRKCSKVLEIKSLSNRLIKHKLEYENIITSFGGTRMSRELVSKEIEMEVTKAAYFLEETIRNLENDNTQLRQNKPREPMPPHEPSLEMSTVDALPYPTINVDSDMPKINWKIGVIVAGLGVVFSFIGSILLFSAFSPIATILTTLGGLCIPAGIILIVVMAIQGVQKKNRLKAERIQTIENSAEYKRSCAEIDEQNRQRQTQLDKELHNQYQQRCEEYKIFLQKYEDDVKYYNDTVIPEWEEELATVETALNNAKGALKELYDKNIIPMKYRNHSAVLWLATYLNTSQSDLEEAIRRFDTDVMIMLQGESIELARAQLMVAQQSLQNQQYANWLNEQMVELTQEGNEILKGLHNWQILDTSVRLYDRAQKKRAVKRAQR